MTQLSSEKHEITLWLGCICSDESGTEIKEGNGASPPRQR